MFRKRAHTLARDIQMLFRSGAVGGLSDAQLLKRFLTRHGEAAEASFEALVQRHGPMVLRVCGGRLANLHDIQDAFQATFLVFARRASSIRKCSSFASWLHGVALRVSARARAHAERG
jgi:DNA-directed RNA polymerase specialized sigma24 family protein